ncbi:bifunctional diguanylate cyclase/phosphodiesterase [Roseomonas marmotae]|uniref:EAL domain-containing protein n=1 Tax=Roseomonas marmotae TaxID=2768161 RepID=A0ABS3KFL0_9PROT|nr:EAL domain-containing protein [Roseomonas marmotae]MBO1075767.1 EAL domain-containing protein [Roseomonas marmotae]QTI80494.1 EAL domain-containing protein [Roseomonas marmotae]
MLRVYTCLTEQHDPLLVILAVAVCLIGAGISLALLRRAAGSGGLSRAGWLLLGGVAGGTFVWCTHFIAMLAYEPGFPLGFGLLPTIGSLLLAILGWGLASTLAVWRRAALAGGMGMGLTIGLMHYTGMAAIEQGGVVSFEPLLVTVSLLLGMGCGVMALRAALGRDRPWRDRLLGTLWLALAVASLHFSGMAAATVIPLGPAIPPSRHPELAVAVAAVGLLVMAAAAAAWMIDRRNRAESGHRLRGLANSTLEGLAVVEDGRIVEANDILVRMLGRGREEVLEMSLPGGLLSLRDRLKHAGEGEPREGWLHHADGSVLEVEVAIREDAPGPGMTIFAFRDLRERREQERRIRHLAVHDPLTGLPTRARFAQRMDQMLRLAERQEAPPSLAMLHLGLDRFKDINDLHGHAGGDALLHGLGRRITQALPRQAFAARLGSDEFGVLMPFQEPVEVFDLITRLEGSLAEPSHISGAELSVTAAMGVSLYPADGRGGEDLRANADLAMRRAKASPGRGLCFYHAEMDAAERHRRRMKEDLRIAIGCDQLRLVCQVQVNLLTGAPCGHEMLLRWHHPERGMVPPSEFIPLAEETGLILPIGDWVLREACAIAAAHPALGKVAVNLSPVQFSQPDLPRVVAQALSASGLPAERLELEITETMLMQDRSRTLPLLERIKALGVRVAMDDFGTGYSSLGTLRSFPFDKIKLDRTFMTELDTSPQAVAILRAVIGIGRALEIPVLAEGVESQAQLDLLRREGCDEAQGYLFGRPGPVPGRRDPSISSGDTLAA